MAQGYERREGVQDPNAARAKAGQPDSIPLTGVQGPSRANFSGVGQEARALSEILQNAGGAFQDYLAKKRDEDMLEGKIAYTQGMTEVEAHKRGEAFSEGWLGIKLNTAMGEMKQKAIEDISNHSGKSPQEYRKVLMDWSKEIMNQASGSPIGKKMAVAFFEDNMPELAAMQVKAHNEYNKQETLSSLQNNLSITSQHIDPNDPDATVRSLHAKFSEKYGNITDKEKWQAITNAAVVAAEGGSKVLLNALKSYNPDFKVAIDAPTASLKTAIWMKESGNKDFNSDGTLVRGPMITNPKSMHYGDRAWGRGQVMSKTLDAPGLGIVPAKDRSVAEINRVSEEMIDKLSARYSDPRLVALAYHSGYGRVDKMLNKADPRKGEISWQKFMDGFQVSDGNNTSAQYAADVIKNLGSAQGTISPMQRAVLMGARLQSMHQSKDQNPRAEGFEGLSKYGVEVGNIHALIQAEQRVNKEEQKKTGVMMANRDNTVSDLPKEWQQDALQVRKNEIREEFTKRYGENLTPGQEDEARGTYLRYASETTVVDEQIKNNINRNLSVQNISGSDGTVNPQALEAYKQFVDLRKYGPPGYADQYLGSPETKRFVYNAMALDAGKSASPQALLYAKTIEDRLAKGEKLPDSVDMATLDEAMDAELDKIDYSVWDRIMPRNVVMSAGGFFDTFIPDALGGTPAIPGVDETTTWKTKMTSEELQNFKTDPGFRDVVTALALVHKRQGYNDKAAVSSAMQAILPRTQVVLGNVLIGGDTPILEDLGVPMYTSPNSMHEAVVSILATNGEKQWGSAYKAGGVEGIFNTISSVISGVPNDRVSLYYDADGKYLLARIYNADKSAFIGPPMKIEAKDIGRVMMQQELKRSGF